VIVKARPLGGKADVVGTKLLKINEFLSRQLLNNDFKAIKSGWEWDRKSDAAFYFLFGKKPLPKTVEVEGPPTKIRQHLDNFKKIHRKTFVKNSRIFAVEKRKFAMPEDLLKYILKSQFVGEKSSSIKLEVL